MFIFNRTWETLGKFRFLFSRKTITESEHPCFIQTLIYFNLFIQNLLLFQAVFLWTAFSGSCFVSFNKSWTAPSTLGLRFCLKWRSLYISLFISEERIGVRSLEDWCSFHSTVDTVPVRCGEGGELRKNAFWACPTGGRKPRIRWRLNLLAGLGNPCIAQKAEKKKRCLDIPAETAASVTGLRNKRKFIDW